MNLRSQVVRPSVILAEFDTITDLIIDAFEAMAAGYVCSRMLKK